MPVWPFPETHALHVPRFHQVGCKDTARNTAGSAIIQSFEDDILNANGWPFLNVKFRQRVQVNLPLNFFGFVNSIRPIETLKGLIRGVFTHSLSLILLKCEWYYSKNSPDVVNVLEAQPIPF